MSTGATGMAASGGPRPPLLAGAVALYALGAAALSPAAYLGVLWLYLQQFKALPVVLLVGPPLLALLLRPRAPLAALVDMARRGGPRLGFVLIAACFGLAAFTTYKLAIPRLVPFYADHVLGDIDALLHGGVNPGEWAHAVLPAWAAYPLAHLYGPTWFLLWLGLLALVALLEDAGLRHRYYWTMALAFALLGTLAATGFSSVGPVLYERFYGSDRYAALTGLIDASAAGDYMRQATGYLYANYMSGGHRAGTGISAMPSMHLAVVTLNALLLGRLHRLLGVLGWAYVALVMFGSVYLGWHYAIDGYVSIAVVALLWGLAGRFTGDDRRRRASPRP